MSGESTGVRPRRSGSIPHVLACELSELVDDLTPTLRSRNRHLTFGVQRRHGDQKRRGHLSNPWPLLTEKRGAGMADTEINDDRLIKMVSEAGHLHGPDIL